MKKYIALILSLFLLSEINFAQKADIKTDVISIYHWWGDGSDVIYVGSNKQKLQNVQNVEAIKIPGGPPLKRGVFVILNEKEVQYLSEYIRKNCKIEDNTKSEMWVTKTYSSLVVKKRCSYSKKDDVKAYFIGMTEWINHSKNKDNYKKLLQYIKGYTL